jgi:hypothetical protein
VRRTSRSIWTGIAALTVVLTAQGAVNSLEALASLVMTKGPVNQLPAHLSTVLGIGQGEATPVRQAVLRDGSLVRTFNVRTNKPGDLVLIAYNEQSRASKVYLVSTGGELRKAVSYQAGGPPAERSATDAQSDFAIELKFWTDFERQSAPQK